MAALAAQPQANGRSALANGSRAPSETVKQGKGFELRPDWSQPQVKSDHNYGERKLDCSEEEWRARVDLAAAYRICHRLGYNEGIVNHLSVVVPGETDRFLVIPFGLSWSEVQASNLLVIDHDANVFAGRGKPENSAFKIHAPIHKRHPDAAALFHTHQREATALCALEKPELPMLNQNCQFFYDDIAVDEYRSVMISGSEGDRLADAMGSKHVLLHQNHGVIVAGETVAMAFHRLYYLEKSAAVVNRAYSLNRPLKFITDEAAKEFKECSDKVISEYARLALEAVKRELLQSERDRDFCT